jgi:hypothetical protein
MKKPQKSLKNWTKQKWRTSDGSPSKGKKRYLPDAAWNSLSSGEKAATNRAKAKGNAKGKQFVKQPKKIADKVKRFRAAEGGMAKGKKVTCPKCKGAGCSHCGGKGYHMGMNKGGDTGKNPNAGIAALRKVAPQAVKRMGFRHGGMANCGASMKPGQKSSRGR